MSPGLTRRYLKLKLSSPAWPPPPPRLAAARARLAGLARGAVRAGEAHSALLLAPPLAAAQMISSVFMEMEDMLRDDAIIIRLNGLLHSDDKLALEAITAQMKLENAVGDRVFGTFAENLAFLLNCLRTGEDRKCKSMVFLLEEFHMFCHTGHTQTLLYNLFDITHSKQAPMLVLGITERLDVMELLEKRVKSRFSHRLIYLFPDEHETEAGTTCERFVDLFVDHLSLPLSFTPKRKSKCDKKNKTPKSAKRRSTLKLDDSESIAEDTSVEYCRYAIPLSILERCKTDVREFEQLDTDFIEEWNAHVKALSEDPKVVDAIEKFCYFTVNEDVFKDVLVVARLSDKQSYISISDIITIVDKTVSPDHRVLHLQSLSILELSLVIAMKHGAEIFDNQPCNFEMVLHRYTKFAQTNSTTQSVPRSVILKAFEHLQALEIITPVNAGASGNRAGASRLQKEYQLYTLSVPIEDIRAAVKGFKSLPTEIAHWFDSSVV